jgi:hypothetical protein
MDKNKEKKKKHTQRRRQRIVVVVIIEAGARVEIHPREQLLTGVGGEHL